MPIVYHRASRWDFHNGSICLYFDRAGGLLQKIEVKAIKKTFHGDFKAPDLSRRFLEKDEVSTIEKTFNNFYGRFVSVKIPMV